MFFLQNKLRLQGEFSAFRDFNFDYLWIHVPSSVFLVLLQSRYVETAAKTTLRVLLVPIATRQLLDLYGLGTLASWPV